MTPEEFSAKLEELRVVLADKVIDLEEHPKWGGLDERELIVQALDEIVVQAQALSEALQTTADDEGDSGEE